MASRWKVLDLQKPLPDHAATYVICVPGEAVLYVGQTNDLRNRLSGHGIRLVPGGITTKVWGFIPDAVVKIKKSRRYGDWLMDEARLIRRIRPALNKQLVRGFGNRREFTDQSQRRLNDLMARLWESDRSITAVA